MYLSSDQPLLVLHVFQACSGKFHPIFQLLYFDSLECLPEEGDISEASCQPVRYSLISCHHYYYYSFFFSFLSTSVNQGNCIKHVQVKCLSEQKNYVAKALVHVRSVCCATVLLSSMPWPCLLIISSWSASCQNWVF